MKDLSELLVSLALGALVIAGALEMHMEFVKNGQKQQAEAELQASLRVSLRLISSSLRAAGAGGPVIENDQAQCPGAPRPQAPLEWKDGRLRILSTRGGRPLLVSGEGGGELHILDGPDEKTAPLAAGERFLVIGAGGVCAREVSAGEPRAGAIAHDPARSRSCFNPAPADDQCLQRCTQKSPCALRRLAVTEYRVKDGKLSVKNGESAPWKPIAENIDELTVNFLSAGAVRLTLSAHGRSLSEVIALRNVSSSS